MIPSWHSDFMSLHWIVLFIPCLNSLINNLSSSLLPLVTLLNSYINLSIILLFCSILFNSATFTVLLSSPSNFFLDLPEISLQLCNLIILLPNSPLYFTFRYLLIFPTHIMILIILVLSLLHFSSLFLCIVYKLSEISKPCL